MLANKVHLFREGHKSLKKSLNFICCCFESLKKEGRFFFQIYVAFLKYVDFTNAHVLITQHIFMFGLMQGSLWFDALVIFLDWLFQF